MLSWPAFFHTVHRYGWRGRAGLTAVGWPARLRHGWPQFVHGAFDVALFHFIGLVEVFAELPQHRLLVSECDALTSNDTHVAVEHWLYDDFSRHRSSNNSMQTNSHCPLELAASFLGLFGQVSYESFRKVAVADLNR